MYCTRLTESTGRKKDAKICHLHNIALLVGLCLRN